MYTFWDDLVFRYRNKSYGAYQLRKRQPQTTLVSFCISSVAMLGLVFLGPLLNQVSAEPVAVNPSDEPRVVILPPLPEPEEEEVEAMPQPAPPAQAAPLRKQVDFSQFDLVDNADADLSSRVTNLDTVTDQAIGTEHIGGDTDPNPLDYLVDLEAGATGKPDIVLSERPNAVPEDNGEFIAGLSRQPKVVNLDLVERRVEYPQAARDMGLSGSVVFRVYFDEFGSYVKHRVVKSPSPILTRACVPHLPAIRTAPGLMGDRAIGSWVSIPFRFQLK